MNWQPRTSEAGDPPSGGGGGADPVQVMHGHFSRQATPEVWAEIDELRHRAAQLEAALRLALTDTGCAEQGLCEHWMNWHVVARRLLGLQP